MDEDLKKVLKELTRSVTVLSQNASQADTLRGNVTPPNSKVQTTLGGVVLAITVLGAFFGVLKYTISSEVRAALDGPKTDLTTITGDVKTLRRDVDELRGHVDGLRVQRSAELFAHPTGFSPKLVGEAAQTLRQQSVLIPRANVISTAQGLLRNVSANPQENWEVENQVLSYLSFLNTGVVKVLLDQGQFPHTVTSFSAPEGWLGQVQWLGRSRRPLVPQLRFLGSPDANEKLETGPSHLLLTGGRFVLDGLVMKRVILKDMEVVYEGGPINLSEVYFVNCTFTLREKPATQRLVLAMLTPDGNTTVSST